MDISEDEIDIVGGADNESVSQNESFTTFAKTFSDFTRCLGTNNQPIAFIFHDLHWADEKSLDLIDAFFSHANANAMGFFLLVSQRTGSHLSNPRFDRFLEKFSKLKRRFTRIELERIQKDSIAEIVGNMLMSTRHVSDDLINYLDEQSRGNPMHLVELTRTLVARNYISMKTFGGEWEYDMTAVRATQIKLNTIDLILSRMGEYDDLERKILRVAATVGITFQFEIILLENAANRTSAAKAIKKAMEEGLIIRVTDDVELKNLGKTYMFTHKKARDAIYESMDLTERRRLHRSIGELIETAIQEPSGKLLFSLAHHFNAAMDNGSTGDMELAKRSLKYNSLAGAAAKQIGSWQTAERYYENADRIMNAWKGQISTELDKVVVRETLGDLASLQKRHGQALKVYRELLQAQLPVENFASIAYKSIYFQVIGGIISESEQLLFNTLEKLNYRLDIFGFWQRLKVILKMLYEKVAQRSTLRRYYWILGLAFQRFLKIDEATLDAKYPVIKLLSLAQLIQLYENKNEALFYHHAVLKEALAGRGSANSLIRAVAERAALLGVEGNIKLSYKLFEAALDVATDLKLKNTYGYVCLIRVLTIDYIKGRHEELSHHLNNALSLLRSSHDDRWAYSQAMVFKIYRELSRCNFVSLYRHCQHIPEIVPTRSLLAPRSMALMLFSYLLQGSRNHVVRHGEMFIKRRQAVSGRETDLFVKVVNTMIAFARGEVEKTREAFLNFVGGVFKGQKHEFFFPYEFDFLGLFSFVFPLLYEHEYGRKLLRDDERKLFLNGFSKLKSRSAGRNGPVPLLLAARTDELLGRKAKIRFGYDSALKSAKESGNNLVQILAYFWFGTHLIDLGNKNRREFLRRAYIISQKCEMHGMMLLIKKVVEKRKVNFPEIASTEDPSNLKKGSQSAPQIDRIPLNMVNLQFVSEALGNSTSLVSDLDASIKILRKFYQFDRLRCLMPNQVGQLSMIYSEGETSDDERHKLDAQMVGYIEPYFNLKSTLFVPFDDAPWNAKRMAQRTPHQNDNEGSGVEEKTFDDQSTLVLVHQDHQGQNLKNQSLPEIKDPLNDPLRDPRESPDQGTHFDSSGEDSSMPFVVFPRPEKLQMSALIPIRSYGKSLGVIFIENIAQTLGRDTTYSRLELDQFGAQLGVLFERKKATVPKREASGSGAPLAGQDIRTSPPGPYPSEAHPLGAYQPGAYQPETYQSGQYSLEPVSWLKIWHSGRLRAQRETVWFLGLNLGPDHYVVCYTQLAGVEEIREKMGAMIWNHFFVLRTLAYSSGKRRIDMNDFYDELVGFFRYIPKAAQLEGISIAVSVFKREDKTVLSGHFGPARPIVLGAENIVTPSNDVVMTYLNGRDLRYWEVEADLSTPHTYILSYDTSRLDSVPVEPSRKKIGQYMEKTQSPDDYHRALAHIVEIGLLPRYYLGVILSSDKENSIEETLSKLGKAQ